MDHGGLYQIGNNRGLVMVKDAFRTMNSSLGDPKSLTKALRFIPYVEYEHDEYYNKKLAPIEMLIWEG